MRLLVEVLPDLVVDIEGALVRIGRGDVADQLREVELERWTYDDFADTGYLYVRSPRKADAVHARIAGVKSGETVSPLEDLNLDLDDHRRITGIELLGARSIISRLERAAGTTPGEPL
jgi:uncharacterized protein YuzE